MASFYIINEIFYIIIEIFYISENKGLLYNDESKLLAQTEFLVLF